MTDRVELLLRGRMTERFISRVLQEGVRLQLVRRTGVREMKLAATEKNARRLLELADQFGLELKVLGEAGKPLFRKRLAERGTLPLGLVLGLMLITMFTARIWRVEAVSLDGAADDMVLAAICRSAAEYGARPGRLRSDIDRDALAMQLHEKWPALTHVSVRADGVFLRIEVAAEDAAPEVYDISKGRDLVASQDAVIIGMEPLAGKACVKAGDTVRRGQLLIRGEERIDTNVTRSIRALGSVIGRVWFTAEYSAPEEETIFVRTGNQRIRARLRLGKWVWTIAQAEAFDRQETETEYLPIGGLWLPLRIERTILWETQKSCKTKDPELLRMELAAQALETARERMSEGALETDCRVDFWEKNGILTARAIIEAETEIAVERGLNAD